MAYLFDPHELHEIARMGVGAGTGTQGIFGRVCEELQRRHPDHVRLDQPWIFNNAGGAMGAIKLLHCSLTEYLLLFGTPIGTEGHSGRYRTEVFDYMLDGEMWTYFPGDTERTVFRPGDEAYLGPDEVKGYRIPERAWMLEYSRGLIPTMLPFGLADTLFSTLDTRCTRTTLTQYGGMVIGNLLRGKV